MQLRSKPIVFLAATALAAGVAVPSALALSGGGSRPTLPTVSRTDDQAQPPKADQRDAEKAENEQAENEQAENQQPEKDETSEQSGDATTPAQPPTTMTTNTPGATGDANRSATAAKHSQADEHRATAPGQPAQATSTDDHAKGSDDATAENENEQNEQQNQTTETTEVEHRGDDDGGRRTSGHDGSDNRGGDDSHDGSTTSGS